MREISDLSIRAKMVQVEVQDPRGRIFLRDAGGQDGRLKRREILRSVADG
jgi:hypothetical protein